MTFMDSSPDNLTTSNFLLVQYSEQNHYHISLVAYTSFEIVGLLSVWVTNSLLVVLILLPFYFSTI